MDVVLGSCTTCGGTGECQNCRGSGHIECSTCNTQGTVPDTCPSCFGTGSDVNGQPCSTCGGSRTVDVRCPSCNGRGNFTCSQCYGGGKCKDCGGTGEIRRDANGSYTATRALASVVFNGGIDLFSEAATRAAAYSAAHYRSIVIEGPLEFWLGGPRGAFRSGLEILFRDVQFGTIAYSEAPAEIIDRYSRINDSDTQDTFQYTNRKTSVATIQVQVTRGVRNVVGMSSKFSIPYIGESSLTASIDINFSETTTTTQQTTQEWSWSETIQLPRRSTIDVTVTISKQLSDVPVKGIARISGGLWGRAKYAGIGAWGNWCAPLGLLFRDNPHADVVVVDAWTVDVPVECTVRSVAGTKIVVVKRQSPIIPVALRFSVA